MSGPEESPKQCRIKHRLRNHQRFFFGTPSARDRRSAPYFLCPVSQNYSALFTDLQSLHIGTMDHSLATLTEAAVAFIPHKSMQDLTARFPNIAAVLWRDTLIDAAIFREWMVGMGRRSAYERIAHIFCELYLKLHAVGLAQ